MVFVCAAIGWFVQDFYSVSNAALISVKFRVYDLVLMVLVTPLSIAMFILAVTGRVWAKIFVLGIVVYLAFSYCLYKKKALILISTFIPIKIRAVFCYLFTYYIFNISSEILLSSGICLIL